MGKTQKMIPVTFEASENPAWKKQFKKVKKELEKLSQISPGKIKIGR